MHFKNWWGHFHSFRRQLSGNRMMFLSLDKGVTTIGNILAPKSKDRKSFGSLVSEICEVFWFKYPDSGNEDLRHFTIIRAQAGIISKYWSSAMQLHKYTFLQISWSIYDDSIYTDNRNTAAALVINIRLLFLTVLFPTWWKRGKILRQASNDLGLFGGLQF